MTTQARWRIAGKTISVQMLSSECQIPKSWVREAEKYATDMACGPGDLELLIDSRNGTHADQNAQTDEDLVSDRCGTQPLQISDKRIGLNGIIGKRGTGFCGRFTVDARYEIPFTAIMRTCLSFVCEQANQLMLHASGVRRNGRLWLFCGAPGTGKSTIAIELNDGGKTFCSDRVILGLGEGGDVVAYPTPFSSESHPAENLGPGKVSGIALIGQAQKSEIQWIEPAEVSLVLLRESRTISRATDTWSRVMALVERVVEKNICFQLRFTKDTSFWALLDRFDSTGRTPETNRCVNL